MSGSEDFSGLIAGYPEVAVDRFVGRCLNARFFLLSHLHTDHMAGLASPELLAKLEALPNPRLLLSPQSAALLASWPHYSAVLPYLRPLEVGRPHQLTAQLVVTPLPAAHCPGSVMFLLEAGDGGTVLYTGDFRLSRRQLTEMRPLHDDGSGRPKRIDVLYADTTFCVPGRRELPERSRSAECVERLVTEWLRLGPAHRANLNCKARYGYESVFRRLHEVTGMRVHVGEEKFRLYERLPDIARCVTPGAGQTRLHACQPGAACQRDVAGGPLRSITLSTLYFFQNQSVDRLEYPLGGERYRVLYSFHASLSQVQEMVAYLRPGRVVPCVVPPGGSLESVVALLNGGGQRELGSDDERDGRRPPLLRGSDWERQPKRSLLPLNPVENGQHHDAPMGDRQTSTESKRTRLELLQSPGRCQSDRESSRRHQGHQESPQRPAVQRTGQGARTDPRPAWRCPFDSD